MKKKTCLALSLLTAFTLLTSGCSQSAQQSSNSPSQTESSAKEKDNSPITIALPTWTGYGPLFLAKEKGFFEKNGATVNLTIIDGLAERKQAMAGGQIQGMATTTDVHVSLASSSVPVAIVWLLDASDGGDGILAKNEIASIKDLKGKKVALDVGGISHFFLLKALEKEGLTDKDVEIVQMSAGDAGAAFVAGKVDAAVTWEPWLSKGKDAGGKILISSKDMSGIIVDSLNLDAQLIKNKPDQVKAIVAGLNEAMNYWKEHEDESVEIMAKGLKISAEEFKSTATGLKFHTLADNKELLGSAAKPGVFYTMAKEVSDFYLSKKMIDKAPDINDLIDSSFVQNIN